MTIFRLISRLFAGIMGLISLIIVIAHNQPYHLPDELAIITPDMSCNPPCVFGIQPGVSNVDEAQHALEKYFKPEDILIRQDIIFNYNIIIKPSSMPNIREIYLHADRRAVIDLIAIRSTIPLVAHRLMSERPDEAILIGDCRLGSFVELYGDKFEMTYDNRDAPIPRSYARLLQRPISFRVVARHSDTTIYNAKGSYSTMVSPISTVALAHRSC